MNTIKRFLAVALSSLLALSAAVPANASVTNDAEYPEKSQEDMLMRYDVPASKGSVLHANQKNENEIWQQFTLPIGNGDMGANIYGEIESEHLTFNEKTLWTGGPSASRPDYNGGNKLTGTDKDGHANTPMSEIFKQIRELFSHHTKEDNAKASELCNQLVGISSGYGAYQAWGDIYFDFSGINQKDISDYVRDLNLNNAVASVSFKDGQTEYNREFLMSHPDKVLAIKLTAKGANKLNLAVRFPSKQGAATVAKEDSLILKGKVADNGLEFDSQLKAVCPSQGKITAQKDKLVISGADSVCIYVAAATNYKQEYPKYRTKETEQELREKVKNRVEAAAGKGYDAVKKDHIKDYSELFSRVSLNLGQTATNITTDRLLKGYNSNSISEPEKRNLEVLLFQYGRYLLLSSSREDSQLPANLQGVWNNRNDPPWSSDYHMNVNLQMNYWPAYSTNLSECALPLIHYVNALREPGRETARIYTGVTSKKDKNGNYIQQNGFMAHTQNTPFGWTCPGWDFSWGWSPAAVPWILQNCFEMYEYGKDNEFLKNTIYPMMKEEVALYDKILLWDPIQKRMVSSPTYSPEHGPRTVGNTYEQTLIWQLYHDTIKAAESLNAESAETIAKWKDTESKLKPIQIGADGQIKEWFDETTLGSMPGSDAFGHRHLSHLLGLFPGNLISVDTPEYLKAAIVSLSNRTDRSTGWGMGQRINTWARAGKGDKAHKLITDLFQNGIYQNLWDTHTPFQIDGNFGYTSGISQMLLQSNVGYINILPALPKAWANGEVSGLMARGDFEVQIKWEKGKAEKIGITSKNGETCTVCYPNLKFAQVYDENGKPVSIQVVSDDKILFETAKGKKYFISNITPQIPEQPAPKNVKAERISDKSVQISWDSSKDTKYSVYRQVENGEQIRIAENLENSEFTDQSAPDFLKDITYSVSAVKDGKESTLSAPVSVKDLRGMAGFIDDQDKRISYTGSDWGNWKENVNFDGTVKFIENPKGGETASLLFAGTGIEVIASRNANYGKYDVYIDNKKSGEIDLYSPQVKRQQVVFSKTDLPFGSHEIKLVVTNTKNSLSSGTKVELDAFKVLDSTMALPKSIKITSESGMLLVSKPNSVLQMQAEIVSQNAAQSKVLWSVDKSDLAEISSSGKLTLKSDNGKVKVTARLEDYPEITAEQDVTINIPKEEKSTIVEDAKNNKPNPEITWTGNWSTWAGESQKHHGGTKTEIGQVGASASYTFSGTGIEVYVQKHANFSSFDIFLDGNKKGNYSLNGSTSGDNQQLLAKFTGLSNSSHTIKLQIVARDGKTQANIDYFKVFSPAENSPADKSDLQDLILETSKKEEADYTAESWKNFHKIYQVALDCMNDVKANQAAVNVALQNLQAGEKGLQKQEKTIAVPKDATVQAFDIESKTLVLSWSKVKDAAKYEVFLETDGSSKKVWSGTDTHCRINNLTPKTSYGFLVKAISSNGQSADFKEFSVSTGNEPDNQRPSSVSNVKEKQISETEAKISWSASTDNVGVKEYCVYVNGEFRAQTKNTAMILKNLQKEKRYLVQIVAKDFAGNTSLVPSEISFVISANEVSKEELHKVIMQASEVKLEQYVEKGKKEFSEALSAAENTEKNKGATAEEVKTARITLLNAMMNLRRKADKTELEKLVEQSSNINLSGFSNESVKRFNEALMKANKILKEDIELGRQPKIQAAKMNLEKAGENLVKQANIVSGKNKPQKTNKKEEMPLNINKETTKPLSAKTSDSGVAAGQIVLMTISIAAIVILKKKH